MQCPYCFFHISAFRMFLRTTEKECHCEPVTDVTDVAPSRDSLRSQSVPPWLPLWGSCHEVTERVNSPSPPHSGHLSHRERQDPHPSRTCGRRASHLPHRGRLGRTDCDRRESLEGATPVLRHWFAMTCAFGWYSKNRTRPHPAQNLELSLLTLKPPSKPTIYPPCSA